MPAYTPSFEDLEYFVGPPAYFPIDDAIQSLRAQHYGNEFVGRGRTLGAVTQFLERTTVEGWDDPNESDLRGRFAKPLVISGFDNVSGALEGYVYGANNASSKRGQPLGALERWGKLHVPIEQLLDGRYLLIREAIGPDEVTIAGMTVVLASRYRKDQPMAVWPYNEEPTLIKRLNEWDVPQMYVEEPDGSKMPEYTLEHVFGDHRPTVEQYHFVERHLENLIDRLLEIDRVPEAVEHIESNLTTV